METTPNQGFHNQSQQQSPLEVTRLSILSTLRVRPLPHAENAESAEVRPLREGRWGQSPVGPPLVGRARRARRSPTPTPILHARDFVTSVPGPEGFQNSHSAEPILWTPNKGRFANRQTLPFSSS